MVPSRYYDTSDEFGTKRIAVITCGVPRSATVWMFQIMRDLYPNGGVVKTHYFLDVPTNIPTIATIRDFRDCIVSYWRIFYPQQRTMTREQIYRMVSFMRGWIDHFRWTQQHRRVTLLRYETFIKDPYSIFDPISNTTGITITAETRKTLVETHSLGRNKALLKMTDTVPEGYGYLEYPIPEGHVHEGQCGTWKRFVDVDGGNLLTSLLTQPLEEFWYVP